VAAVLRRTRSVYRTPGGRIEFGDISVDLAGAEVHRDRPRVDLTARECLLLRYLIENCGTVQSRDTLLEAVLN
jgi:DNA-binding response OmpR family regulator